MQDDICLDDNLQFYSYSGRNFEIIHLCEKKFPFSNAIDFAINTHQNDLVDYFIDNFKDQIENDESLEKFEDEENPYRDLSINSLKEALRSMNYKIILPSLKRIVYIVNNIEKLNVNNFLFLLFNPQKTMLESCFFDLDLFKFIYNQNRERYISFDSNSHKYSMALFNGAYDAIKYMFEQTDKESLFNHFGHILNADPIAADIILDILDHEEYEAFFENQDIYDYDLFSYSLKKYNEKVVVKMIRMFKWFPDIQMNFRSESLKLLSSKMIVSLCKKLSSVLDVKVLLMLIDFYIDNIDDEDIKSKLVEIKKKF